MVQVLKCVLQYIRNLLYLVVNIHVITAIPWCSRLQQFGSPDSLIPTKNNLVLPQLISSQIKTMHRMPEKISALRCVASQRTEILCMLSTLQFPLNSSNSRVI